MFSWYGLALYENLCRCTLFYYRFRVLLTLADSRNLTLALYGLLAVSVACPIRRYLGYGGAWNIFDTALVAVSLYSNMMSLLLLDGSASAGAVQTLRIFRVVRAFG